MLALLYKSLEHAFMYFGLIALFCFSALKTDNLALWFGVCFVVAVSYNLLFKRGKRKLK